jgi:hypothetical protein
MDDDDADKRTMKMRIEKEEAVMVEAAEDVVVVEPIFVPPGSRRAFYVTSPDGPFVRYSDVVDRLYYEDSNAVIYGAGTAKRIGWDSMTLSPRLFSGAVRYRRADAAVVVVGAVDDENGIVDPMTATLKRPSP